MCSSLSKTRVRLLALVKEFKLGRWRELIGAPAVALCRSALPSPGSRAQRVPWVLINWDLITGANLLGETEQIIHGHFAASSKRSPKQKRPFEPHILECPTNAARRDAMLRSSRTLAWLSLAEKHLKVIRSFYPGCTLRVRPWAGRALLQSAAAKTNRLLCVACLFYFTICESALSETCQGHSASTAVSHHASKIGTNSLACDSVYRSHSLNAFCKLDSSSVVSSTS